MASKKQTKSKKPTPHSPLPKKKLKEKRDYSLLPWFCLVAALTAVCLWPMLKNEFTNWDDEFYVTNNPLLRGPDWKRIFSEQVLGNYHPLTILSYAFNFAISGLNPFSYLLVNYLFHIINTLLVFYFIWNISGKNKVIAAFVALVFGIHPMHVESVAWVAERKDVLYTFFFLLSLIEYWIYLTKAKRKNLVFCFVFFVLSLLSKPAAIVLPLVLFLLDYWYGQSLKKNIVFKIPFFALSILFGIITVGIQSSSAMAGLSIFSITDRFFFACYVLMTYFVRFFVPYPLSAFHPFPITTFAGWPIYLSPIFVVALLAALWFLRKNKIVVFGIFFYVINLLLVLQIISIGLTIVSERYTYVPYIGLAFMFAMLVSRIKFIPQKVSLAAGFVAIIAFGVITFQRTKVWKNSGTLWTDALKTYPRAPYARTNRANYLSKLALRPDQKPFADSIYKVAFEDCAIALSVRPNHAPAFEYRGLMYLDRQQFKEGLADANELIRLKPDYRIGYDMRATCYYKMNEPAKALADYDKCVEIKPDDHRSINNRGSLYMNSFQKYNEALNEFNKAININPQASYILNRSICYYKMGNMQKAKEDALIASQRGAVIPDNYRSLLQLK
jgi:tetratricopeptide (TPR) repeat protein